MDVGSGGGFVFWRNPEARERVFGRIFKGYGPGPGDATPADLFADLPPAPAAVRGGARALRAASDQAELIREIVAVMAGKMGGAVKSTAATQRPMMQSRPVPRASASTTAEVVTNWGARCCAKDIAQVRAALAVIKIQTQRAQSADVLRRLGRRPTALNVGSLIAELEAGLVTFENTSDAASASTALTNIAKLTNALAGVLAGSR
jgi:hypothetical protein